MQPRLVFSPQYKTPISDFGFDKPFALDRGEMVLKQLELDLGAAVPYLEPKPIGDEEILLVHTSEYLKTLQIPKTWIDLFEFKESEYFPDRAKRPLPDILNDFKLKSGGTLLAAQLSLELGLAANLGAGYHHAFPDQGRGYCAINDIAIAIKFLQKQGCIKKAMIVDLDFHQGDGTAKVFQNDPSVFTFSVHSEEGWPEIKQKSDLDIPIKQSEKDLYLEKTSAGLTKALSKFAPDMVIYVAGSDPYEKDVLPGTSFFRLPLSVMKERDELVIDTFADQGIPLSSVFAGGYGPDVWEVHYLSIRRLLERSGLSFGQTFTRR
ncbi:MAG: histone deacetylase [Leptolyngbya sp.]|nr:histone deacetylase [Candidatus Melainabacteria bacterium]